MLLTALVLFGGGGLAWYGYVHYTDPETVRLLAIESARKAFPGARVTIQSASFCLLSGVGLHELEVATPNADGSYSPAIQCDQIHLYPDRNQILQGSLKYRKVVLDNLSITLTRDSEGVWNMAKWIKDKPVVIPYGAAMLIRGGSFHIQDHTQAIPNQDLTDIEARIHLIPKANLQWEIFANNEVLQKIKCTGLADLGKKQISLEANTETTLSQQLLGQLQKVGINAPSERIEQLSGQLNLRLVASITRHDDAMRWNARLTGELEKGTVHTTRLPHAVTDANATFKMTETGVELSRLRFAFGPSWGEISGSMPGWDLEKFSMKASLWGVPLDARLYSHLPEKQQQMWDKFSPEGKVDLHANLQRVDQRFVATGAAELSDISMRFFKFPYPVHGGSGRIMLHDDGHLSLDGRGRAGNAEVIANGTIEGLMPNPAVDLTIRSENVPIDQTMIDSFCAMPDAVQDAVKKFHVTGSCDVVGRFTRESGTVDVEPDINVAVRASDCLCDWFAYPLENVTGTLHITRLLTEFIQFRASQGPATVQVDGMYQKTTDGSQLEVHIDGKDVPLDETLRTALYPNWRIAWDAIQPDGKVGIDCLVTKSFEMPTEVSLKLDPEHAGITPPVFPYRLHNMLGRIRIEGGIVSWSGIGSEPRLLARHDNSVMISCAGSIDTTCDDMVLSLEHIACTRLPVDGSLRNAVPEDLRSVIDFIAPDRPIALDIPRLEISWPKDHSAGPTTSFHGSFRFFDANVIPSIGIKHVTGTVDLAGTCADGYQKITGNIDLDKIDVNGFVATRLQSPVDISDTQIDLKGIRGQFYRGRLTGDLWATFGDEPAYQCQLYVQQASLKEYVNSSYQNAPALDGVVNAGLLLLGSGEDIAKLKGGGSIQIGQADIYRFPILTEIFRAINLETPNDRAFDDVVCDFELDDRIVRISRLDLTGPSMSLLSEAPGGKVNLDTSEIGITMKTRWAKGRLYIPLVTPTLNLATDEFIVIQIRGQIQDPKIIPDPLRGVRRFLEGIERIGR